MGRIRLFGTGSFVRCPYLNSIGQVGHKAWRLDQVQTIMKIKKKIKTHEQNRIEEDKKVEMENIF